MIVSPAAGPRRRLTRYPLLVLAALIWAAGCFSLRTFGLSTLTAFIFGPPPAAWQQGVVLAILFGPIIALVPWSWWDARHSRAYLRQTKIYRPDQVRFEDATHARNVKGLDT